MKHFCTAGPIQSDIHYAVPPLSRIDLAEVESLIDARKYFVLHAPRQSGKTTILNALVDHLNASGRVRALYVNIEGAQTARRDVADGMRTILSVLAGQAEYRLGDSSLEAIRKEVVATSTGDSLRKALTQWCRQNPVPLCLMIDEIDALVGDTLISVLRQLRSGYADRPHGFPQSVILCGVRDVRDYRIHGSREVITGGSAFNIKAESIRLHDFSQADIRTLYTQHTLETGQVFEEAVYPLVWELTRGQPWLVNALADAACSMQRDRSLPIITSAIEDARERLILKRVTHLDQLADKLREPRVRRVIQPILNGDEQFDREFSEDDDLQYVIDLGLVRKTSGGMEIANAIYREVIPRQLTTITEVELESREHRAWYIDGSGKLDMSKLLESFQQFFRENSEVWLERFQYREAGPQLLLQAFLQRIVNGGGHIAREYALGRRRTDLLIAWKHPSGVQRVVIEIKLLRGSLERTIEEGIVQTSGYMDQSGAEEGHLVIFDRTKAGDWESKVFRRAAASRLTLWGM